MIRLNKLIITMHKDTYLHILIKKFYIQVTFENIILA